MEDEQKKQQNHDKNQHEGTMNIAKPLGASQEVSGTEETARQHGGSTVPQPPALTSYVYMAEQVT